ncbi:MAG: pyrimidine operon attenuation protein/uracil phosphoribosyltransferase [Salibacteraceae bacterium]|jgi:pyrimidine operon attenuation protein/uracil phosphoribosyltransferase
MTTSETRTVILDHKQVSQKITRIAHEIIENNFVEKSLVIMGIKSEGFVLAERLVKILTQISDMDIVLHEVSIDKKKPLSSGLVSSIEENELNNKAVILVDDVLNSGKTLVYATKFLLDHKIKRLQTVCLVDRKHRKFPIRADFVGLTLSTTLQEHITVEFGKYDCVYLD